jgi:hypothetical protein
MHKNREINSLRDILELYLPYDFNQELVNAIALLCGKFLFERKAISAELVNYFSLQFKVSEDRTCIIVRGNNLLSSLWLIGVYPPNPEYFVEKTIYKNSDFIYRFYTKNKNLSIKPNNHERKLTSHQ